MKRWVWGGSRKIPWSVEAIIRGAYSQNRYNRDLLKVLMALYPHQFNDVWYLFCWRLWRPAFFKNWFMKFKFPNLLNQLWIMIQKNVWSFYPSEMNYFSHFNMRYPVLPWLSKNWKSMLEIRLRRSRLYLLCEAVLLPPEDNVEGGKPCFEDPSRISVITPNVEALCRGGIEGGGPLEGVAFFLALSHCSTCKVHIFWEGHRIMRNLYLTFDFSIYSQK